MPETEHRVHGLGPQDMPADWPPLHADEVGALLRGYPQLGGTRGIAWHSARPLSAAALVDSEAGTVFVKRHHRRVRTADTLAEEHRFIAHLRNHGAPVPQVLADTGGRTAVAHGDWTYEVHARAEGLDLYRDLVSWHPLRDRDHAFEAGRALARLHAAAAGYDAPQRDTHILVARDELVRAPDPVAVLAAQLPQRPGLADYLHGRDWANELRAVFAATDPALHAELAALPRLWTHNDWHASNLCWSDRGTDARVVAVLDFGLAAPNSALFDLATAIERNAVAWLELERGDGAVHADTARALVAGYASVQPLDAHRLELLAALLPVVHVDFALSETEYFHAITGSRNNADIAYDVFLRGHAAWFAGPSGCRLLRAIRDAG